MPILIRVIALLTTLVVLLFLARGLIDLNGSSGLLFMLMLIGVMGLLLRIALLPANKSVWSKQTLTGIRAHIFLHLVPFSYLALQLEITPSLSVNLLYYIPVIMFFYTGRRTWQAFFEVFDSKIYKIFYTGNTGMLVSLSIVLALGILSGEAAIIAFFQKLFMLYFGVHLLIAGAIVLKIESDITGAKVVAQK